MKRFKILFITIFFFLVISGCSHKQDEVSVFDCKTSSLTIPMTVNIEAGQYIPELELDGEIWRLDTGTALFTITEETLNRKYAERNDEFSARLLSGKIGSFAFNDFFGYRNDSEFFAYLNNSHINTLNLQAFKNCKNVVLDYVTKTLTINAENVPESDRGTPLRLEFEGDLGFIYETLIEWNGEEVWVKIDTGSVFIGERCESISDDEYQSIRTGIVTPCIPRTKRNFTTAELQIGPWYYEKAPVLKTDSDMIMYLSEIDRVSAYYESCLGLPIFLNRKVTFDFERMLFFLE